MSSKTPNEVRGAVIIFLKVINIQGITKAFGGFQMYGVLGQTMFLGTQIKIDLTYSRFKSVEICAKFKVIETLESRPAHCFER